MLIYVDSKQNVAIEYKHLFLIYEYKVVFKMTPDAADTNTFTVVID